MQHYRDQLDFSILKLRECENSIEELKRLQVDDDSKYQNRVKNNLLIVLTVRMREALQKLSSVKSLKEDGGILSSTNGNSSKFGFLEEEPQRNQKLSLMQQKALEEDTAEMDQEINKLADSVSSLHDMFKHLNEIVYEQGQIVDRIDFNVDQALIKIEKGNKELDSARNYQQSACANYVIRIQVLIVLILTVVIVIKFI